MILGQGIAITFDSGFFAELLDVTPPEVVRESIDVSHLGLTNWKEFLPAALADPGGLEVEMGFDPSVSPPITDDAETVTIVFPDSGTTSWSFSGFLTNYGPSVPMEDKMTCTATLKATGEINFNA